MTEPALELAFTVACPPEHAFSVWAERTSLWWPKIHSVSADPGLTVTFEPRAGGRIFERTPRSRSSTRTGSASASASATRAGGAAWCRTTSPPVQPVRTRRPKFGPAAGRNSGARAVACALMEKPKTTAPEKAETTRRWPRSIPDRRVFPRG